MLIFKIVSSSTWQLLQLRDEGITVWAGGMAIGDGLQVTIALISWSCLRILALMRVLSPVSWHCQEMALKNLWVLLVS